jgi:hypothetical protein
MAVLPKDAMSFFLLYITADKFVMEAFKNETMDLVRSVLLPHGFLNALVAEMMFRHKVPGDKVRLWLMRQYAWDYRSLGGRSMEGEVGNEEFKELLKYVRNGVEFAMEVMKAFVERLGGKGKDCRYQEYLLLDVVRMEMNRASPFRKEPLGPLNKDLV